MPQVGWRPHRSHMSSRMGEPGGLVSAGGEALDMGERGGLVSAGGEALGME